MSSSIPSLDLHLIPVEMMEKTPYHWGIFLGEREGVWEGEGERNSERSEGEG